MPVLNRNFTDPSTITTPQHLTSQTHWIRNTLDLQIAHAGPEALPANDLLDIDSFLRNLLSCASGISLATLRSSRIHLAILDICGRATRWPLKVIERAEAIGAVWEAKYGDLAAIGWDVRVEGWEEIVGKRESMVLSGLNIGKARRFGDLGFRPGDWWINPLFAFHAGILDSSDPQGGVVADSKGAYAVLLTGADEISSTTPDKFVYRARNADKGRYRLTAATLDSRHPVRILRSHRLHSFWSPRAGIRYEGLYKVTSWSIVHDPLTRRLVYDIAFKRLASEAPSMEAVLQRPWTEEVEDYKEYKRVRKDATKKQPWNGGDGWKATAAAVEENGPGALASVTASDGAVDCSPPPLEAKEKVVVEAEAQRKDSAAVGFWEREVGESPKGSVIVRATRVMADGRVVLDEITPL